MPFPKPPYFAASIEGLGIKVRDESFSGLQEKLLKEVERKRDRARSDEAALTAVYIDLLQPRHES